MIRKATQTLIPPNFSVDEFVRMIDAGIFEGRSQKFELVRGEFSSMSPASAEHGDVIDWLMRWSTNATLAADFTIRVQSELELRSQQSLVIPDLLWLKAKSYRKNYPTESDVFLVIEVALSSLRFDRLDKSALYAEAGIQEYWLVDLEGQTLEVRRCPKGLAYQDTSTYSVGDYVAPLCKADASLCLSELFIEH